jgi:Ca2+/Na+ antiporter
MEIKIIQDAIQTNFFLYFLLFFYIFYLLFIQKDTNITFFVMLFLIICGIIYWKSLNRLSKKGNDVTKLLLEIQKDLSVEYEIPDKKTFIIHKTPTNIKYLLKKDDFVKIIYDLKFLKIYEKELYYKLISYLNYFLKIHYNVMLEKYDFNLYFQIMKDLRNEILNIMKSIHFSTPNVSTILDIPNVDVFILARTKLMQALTYKYMKIIYHKFTKNKTFSNYHGPFEYDYAKENHYELF